MLARLKGWLRSHHEAAKQSFNALRKTPVASLLTILVIAVALLFPALVWLSTSALQNLTRSWHQEGRISLYLKLDTKAQAETALLQSLKAKPFVGEVSLVSAEEGLKLLQRQEGMADILRYLPHNPLPAVIEIVPKMTSADDESMNVLLQELKKHPEIDEIKMDRQWVTRLHAMIGLLRDMSDGLMIILSAAVLLIVGNTLRMMVQNRQEEIAVLKLIGATDSYIIRPFLYAGFWYGFLGAAVALLLLHLLMICLAVMVNQLASLYDMHMPILGLSVVELVLFLAGASLLGWLGARLSVKSQLTFIEP